MRDLANHDIIEQYCAISHFAANRARELLNEPHASAGAEGMRRGREIGARVIDAIHALDIPTASLDDAVVLMALAETILTAELRRVRDSAARRPGRGKN